MHPFQFPNDTKDKMVLSYDHVIKWVPKKMDVTVNNLIIVIVEVTLNHPFTQGGRNIMQC